jgi:hypothetical protein
MHKSGIGAILAVSLFMIFCLAARASANSFVLCEKDEAICLKILGKRAERSGELLRFHLENGKSEIFRNKTAGCDRGEYENCGSVFITGIRGGYVVLGVFLYEGSYGLLLRLKDGRKIELSGEPIWSPNGERFISAPGAFGSNEPSRIYRFENKSFLVEYVFPPSIDVLTSPEWKTDDAFTIRCDDSKEVTVRFSSGSWFPDGKCYPDS